VGLITRRTVNEFKNAQVSDPYRTLYAEAGLLGIEVVTYNNPRASHPIPRRNRIDWPLVPWSRFDVGLLVEVEFPDSLSDPILRRHRVLAVDQDARFFGLHSVCCDDRGAGREAARLLWGLGHRRFAVTDQVNVRGWSAEPTWLARRQGFEEAVLKLGGLLRPDWRVPGGRNARLPELKQGAALVAERWGALPPRQRPTALLGTDLRVLGQLIPALAAKGIHVPRDLSVIGFTWGRKGSKGRRKAGPIPGEAGDRRPTLSGKAMTAIAIDLPAMARRTFDVAEAWFEKGDAFAGNAEPQLFTSPFFLEKGETVEAPGGR
jgi:hypothetical protein